MTAPLPDLEDRLRGLADGISAPATPWAREGIRDRTTVLHRRRRTRATAAACVCLVAAILGGTLWLSADPDGVQTGTASDVPLPPAQDPPLPVGDPARMPAFTIDHPALEVRDLQELPDPHAPGPSAEDDGQQLFRREGDVLGPFAWVWRGHAGFDPTEIEGDGPVEIGAREGRIDVDEYHVTVVWDVGDGTAIRIDSAYLGVDDTLAFARGLRLRGRGVEATELPQDLSELPSKSDPVPDPTERWLDFSSPERPDMLARIVTRHGGEAEFLGLVAQRLQGTGVNGDATVFGRPAVAITKESGEVRLLWRHTTTDIIELEVVASDRATVEAMIDGITELDEASWEQLKADLAG
jgi:hypothetical protein